WKWCRRSHWVVHRAHLREKKPEAVTQGRSSCPSPGEKARGGYARTSNVPASRRKSQRWSSKAVHRARLRKKKTEVVTQGRSSCPSPGEKARGGHARTSNVPASRRKSPRWSRKNVQCARLRKK